MEKALMTDVKRILKDGRRERMIQTDIHDVRKEVAVIIAPE